MWRQITILAAHSMRRTMGCCAAPRSMVDIQRPLAFIVSIILISMLLVISLAFLPFFRGYNGALIRIDLLSAEEFQGAAIRRAYSDFAYRRSVLILKQDHEQISRVVDRYSLPADVADVAYYLVEEQFGWPAHAFRSYALLDYDSRIIEKCGAPVSPNAQSVNPFRASPSFVPCAILPSGLAVNTICAATAILITVGTISMIITLWRLRRGRCGNCGYKILNEWGECAATCPECGVRTSLWPE